ncbi:hypothetical protein H0H93_016039, partial [Arthromyces matolae]
LKTPRTIKTWIRCCVALAAALILMTLIRAGMCVGWAWGAAAMAAGLSVRNQALLAQQQQRVHASIVNNGIPATVQYQIFIFKGYFLDPGVSAVWGAFFFIGTFALGTLRAYVPKLALLSIFGSIVLDV